MEWNREACSLSSSLSFVDTFCSVSLDLYTQRHSYKQISTVVKRNINLAASRDSFSRAEYFPDRTSNWKMKRKFLQFVIGGGSWKVFCGAYKPWRKVAKFSVKCKPFISFWRVKVKIWDLVQLFSSNSTVTVGTCSSFLIQENFPLLNVKFYPGWVHCPRSDVQWSSISVDLAHPITPNSGYTNCRIYLATKASAGTGRQFSLFRAGWVRPMLKHLSSLYELI